MKRFVSALLAVVFLLAVPAAAGAAEYTVNSTADEPDPLVDGNGCLTLATKCTLRAAIQEANFVATGDTIKFDGSIFEGLAADTIEIGSSLPAIKAPLKIDGRFNGAQCNTAAGVKGPCAGVNGPAAGSALIVEDANGVEVEGLAITGASGSGGAAAINVIGSSEGFEARGNWLGVKLDGSTGANSKGIFLDPNSNGATIGGMATADRNVFANNSFEGLDVEGADNADVLGNYFGVKPDGATQAANGKNIEITDVKSGETILFDASNNEVGGTITGPALTSTACDGACNVLSGSTTGIDLVGETITGEGPASGPTTISGNFVGLNAAGSGVVANGAFDVLVGAADGVTVGGEAPGDTNYIAGGGFGIYHENGEGFAAIGNAIGVRPDEFVTTPPSSVGIFLYSPSTADGPLAEANVISMAGGFGIEQKLGGATIVENVIEGAAAGIFTVGLSPAVGNLIAGNFILEAESNGILIEGDSNEVFANEVFFSGQAGIKIKQAGPPFTSPTTGNFIGGDAESSENLIFGSGGAAIEIVDLEGTQNEVARNWGLENGGLFIDLKAFEPGTEPNGPNGGIKPPTISVAKQSEAAGSAEPGATVRVFRKKTAEAGELESFLAQAIADGSGNWKVTYPASIPGGTIVAATQTNEAGGTSELATATTTADPGGGAGKAGGGGEAKIPTPIKRIPQTKILKGPKAKSHSTTAKFKFSSSEPGSTFQCKLDKRPFKPCKSPKKYKGLKPGKHVFKVWAIDKAGNVDPTPAKRKFKVLE